jgi:hypothetical protein
MRGVLIPAAPIVDPSTANPFLAICSPPPETKPSIMPPSPTPMLAKRAVTPTQTVPLPSPPPTVKRVRRQKPTLPTDEESNPFYCPPGKASSSSSTASALVMAQRQEARRRMEQSETITYVQYVVPYTSDVDANADRLQVEDPNECLQTLSIPHPYPTPRQPCQSAMSAFHRIQIHSQNYSSLILLHSRRTSCKRSRGDCSVSSAWPRMRS